MTPKTNKAKSQKARFEQAAREAEEHTGLDETLRRFIKPQPKKKGDAPIRVLVISGFQTSGTCGVWPACTPEPSASLAFGFLSYNHTSYSPSFPHWSSPSMIAPARAGFLPASTNPW